MKAQTETKQFDSNTLAENTGRVATFFLESTPKLLAKDRQTKERAQYQTGDVKKHSKIVARLMTQERFSKIVEADKAERLAKGEEPAKETAPRFEWVRPGVVRSLSSGKLQWALDPASVKRESRYTLNGETVTAEQVGDILPAPRKSQTVLILTINQETVTNAILPDGIA